MANKRLREEMFDSARGLHDLGLVSAETLREFDVSRMAALKRVLYARFGKSINLEE